MDISKYIGLFLLKNRFCYIHGLGNLELKKNPAKFDGSVLKPSPYEVHITPAGSIDDNLANFIATNEQTSISRAANSLREFSSKSRLALAEGKEVIIPFVGKFTEINSKIVFTTDPDLQYTPPGIPTIKHARRQEEEVVVKEQLRPQESRQKPAFPAARISAADPKARDSAEEEILYDEPGAEKDSINWSKVIIVAVIVVILILSLIFGIRLITRNSKVTQHNRLAADTFLNPAPARLSKSITATPAAPLQAPDSASVYNMVIGTYLRLKDAQKREKQLQSYGHNVHVVTKDSLTYFVVIPMKCKTGDTTHIKDSLKLFEPRGVSIFR